MLFHQTFSFRGVNVSYHNYRHQVRTIPVLVKSADHFRLETFEHFNLAYRKPICVPGSLKHFWVSEPEHSFFRPSAGSFLLKNHTAFLLNLGGVEPNSSSPVFQYLKCFLDVFFFLGWDRQDVYRLIKTRVSVEVRAKLHADRLKE